MIHRKYAYLMICMVIIALLITSCTAGESETAPKANQTICNSKTDSTSCVPSQFDTASVKIIGKGTYTLDEQQKMLGFELIPLFERHSGLLEMIEFAHKNSESEIADDVLLVAAEKYFEMNQSEKAIDILDTIIERYPRSAQVDEGVLFVQRLKLAHIDPPRIRKTKDDLKSYIREHPNLTADEALRRKAFYLETLGNRSGAIKILEKYVEKHPEGRWAKEDIKARPLFRPHPFRRTDELIFHHLAWLYLQNGDHAKAIHPLKQAIQTFAGCSQYTVSYYDLLAKAYQKSGDTKQEIATLLQLRELMRNNEYLIGVEGDERETFSPHEQWRYWLRVRPSEIIDQRLQELEGKVMR